MYWTNSLTIVLLSHVCCFPTASCVIDLDSDKGRHSSVVPVAERPSSTSPLGSSNAKFTRFMTQLREARKRKQSGLNQHKFIAIASINSQQEVLEGRELARTHQNNNPDVATFNELNKDRVDEKATPSDAESGTTGYVFTDGERHEAFSEEDSQWFDKENQLESSCLGAGELMFDLPTSSDDISPCVSCDCSYLANTSVAANCSRRALNAFPFQLPSKTIVIDLSVNCFSQLDTSNFTHYPYLSNVTLASNSHLVEVRDGSLGKQGSNVKVLNLTSCNIITIQDASFDVTPELTHLIIRDNRLRNLTTSTFKGLGKLLHLDLSRNNISFIENGTFNELNALTSLDLSGNGLRYTKGWFTQFTFSGLIKLQKLSIHDNTITGSDLSYPDIALHKLAELRELSVDGLRNPAEFGPEMKALDKLASLEIRGHCKIVNITETFFQNIPNLTSFKMDRCFTFEHVHPKAYTKLARLQSLSLSNMHNYDLKTAFQDLVGLNNTPLTSITFARLRRADYTCRYLGHNFSQYLQNFSLVHLDLSFNFISLMGVDFLTELPTTLKTFILNRNTFTTGTQSLNDLSVLKGVTELDLSMQNVNRYYPQGYSSIEEASTFSDHHRQLWGPNEGIHAQSENVRRLEQTSHELDILEEQSELTRTDPEQSELTRTDPELSELTRTDPEQNELTRTDPEQSELTRTDPEQSELTRTDPEQSELTRTDPDQTREMYPPPSPLKLPPNLRILKASQYSSFGMQILTHILPKKNSLSVIDFSSSFMSIWGTGRLPRGITFANLGNNYCKNINRKFFQPHNSHLQLLLNNNFLGPDFAYDTKGEIFSKLSKTVYLDISTNLIYSIPKLFFSGLSSLKSLKMSDNKLSVLNASFVHMKPLEFIDCSKNSINWIDAETRNDLDTIASSPGHALAMDLTLNPLPCTCDGLELISWMATTKVHFHKEHQLTCYPDNKVVEPMGDLEKRRQQLQRLCMSKSVFIIGCSAALTVVMVIVTLGLMFRYRWKLRYLQNTAMAAMFGFKPEVSPQSGCTFDAYFVYATDTRDFVLDKCLKELEVNRGHRLCVEDRDFWPGTYIVSSIVSAVRNSTKTVVVLTPDYMEEPYCEYSFKMAVMEELYKQRTVLHLLLYQPVASDQMSHDELSLMKRNSYIEYPPDGRANEDVRRAFWDELSEVIGHSGNDTSEPVLERE